MTVRLVAILMLPLELAVQVAAVVLDIACAVISWPIYYLMSGVGKSDRTHRRAQSSQRRPDPR